MIRSDNMNDIGVILLIIIIIIVSILIIEDWHFVRYYALQVGSKRKKKIGKMGKIININQNTDGESQVQCQYPIVKDENEEEVNLRDIVESKEKEQEEEYQNINDMDRKSRIQYLISAFDVVKGEEREADIVRSERGNKQKSNKQINQNIR